MNKHIDEIKIRLTSADVCELFENLLDKFDITIPSDDREGNEEEARIYGDVYVDLEDAVTGMLLPLCEACQQNPFAFINTTDY